MSDKTTRCIQCSAEFTAAELQGTWACPKCGTTSIPCAISQDVTITVNWHELRVLGIWAENYARSMGDSESSAGARRALNAIFDRLEKYRPPGAAALSLSREVKELQEAWPSAELVGADGQVIVKKKDIQ